MRVITVMVLALALAGCETRGGSDEIPDSSKCNFCPKDTECPTVVFSLDKTRSISVCIGELDALCEKDN